MFLSDTPHLYNNIDRNIGDISKHGDTCQDISKHDDAVHDLSKYCTARPIKVENDPDDLDNEAPAITKLEKRKTSAKEFFEKLYGPDTDTPKDDTRDDLTMGDHPYLVYPLPTPPSLLHQNNIALPWPGGLQAFCE